MRRTFAALAIAAVAGAAAFAVTSRDAAWPTSAPPTVQPPSAQPALRLLASGAFLVDVREPGELAETGKLAGAMNAPLTRLKEGWVPAELEAVKLRPVILYCRSGRRSGGARDILLSRGFPQVYNLGGFDDVVKAGMPAA